MKFFVLIILLFLNFSYAKTINIWLIEKPINSFSVGKEDYSGISDLVKKFEIANNVKVNITNFGINDYSNIIMGFLSSNVDIIEINSNWIFDINEIQLIDTNNTNLDYSKYFSSVYPNIKGTHASLYPFTVNAPIIAFDNYFLSKFYFTKPKPFRNYQDMYKFKNSLSYLFDYSYNKLNFFAISKDNLYQMFLPVLNKNRLDIKTLKILTEIITTKEGKIYSSQDLYKNFLYDDNRNLMLLTDFSHYRDFKRYMNKYSYYSLPGNKIPIGGSFLAINRRCKNKIMARKLCSFLSDSAAQLFMFYRMGILIPYKSIWENELYGNDQFLQTSYRILKSQNIIVKKHNFFKKVNRDISDYFFKRIDAKKLFIQYKNIVYQKNSDKGSKIWFHFTSKFIIVMLILIWLYIIFRRRKYGRLDIAISPIILILLFIYILPLVDTLYFLIQTSFKNSLDYNLFFNALFNTFTLTFIKVLGSIILGIFVAYNTLALSPKERGLAKLIFLFPYFTNHNATAYIWKYFFEIAPINFLEYSRITSYFAISVMDIWKTTGFVALILLMFWEKLPKWYYEVYSLVEDNPFKYVSRVLIPESKHIIFFLLTVQVINSLQVFDQLYVLGGITGGANRYFQSIIMLLYEYGFYRNEFSNAIFISVIFSLISILIMNIMKKVGAHFE